MLIISSVHSKTASKIFGISVVITPSNLLTIAAMVHKTVGSRADGMRVRCKTHDELIICDKEKCLPDNQVELHRVMVE